MHQVTKLTINMSRDSMQALSAEILNTTWIKFESLPLLNLFYTPILPNAVVLQYSDIPHDRLDFWVILEFLSFLRLKRQKASILRVHWLDDEEFDWLTPGGADRIEHATLVEQLAIIAVFLHKSGITVVDRHNRDVGSLPKS
jgi:hypothetical protein